MASLVTHAVVAATVAAVYGEKPTTATPWLVGIACAVGPDLDVIGFWLGVPYDSFWGHRGFTHSIVFAVVVSWMCAWWTGRLVGDQPRPPVESVWPGDAVPRAA
jgi:membrane-bound metal-dependent hydrolase YbcI (DUF457 family)